MNLDRLPRPDRFGTYWFGEPGPSSTPAIFVHSSSAGTGLTYFLSMGDRGILFVESKIRLFDRPEKALKELRARLKS